MKKVLLIGASGQLGRCFQKVSAQFPDWKFFIPSSKDLDVTQYSKVADFFSKNNFDYCINCSAYTQVENAETEKKLAFSLNEKAVRSLAKTCKENHCKLVHFSTDYVFDGKKFGTYKEEDHPHPLNVYGASKLAGEKAIAQELNDYFIFRTSWLYSEFGHNFFKTILNKAEKDAVLNITTQQIGTPTNANDLALFVLKIIEMESQAYGLYHFSNRGQASWYDFAGEILRNAGKLEQVSLHKSNNFKTRALRPENSVLSKEKILQTFQLEIPTWQESLKTFF